jgi:GDP-mannose pyrophosphatase NudK
VAINILNEKTIFNDKLIIEKAELSDGENTFSRLRVNRPDAAAILIFNTESKKIILTRQFRYAVASKTPGPIYEIAAGKIDPGESPLDAIIRETEEETGYKPLPSNVKFLVSCFASPGYTSEKFHLYYATVSNRDKVSAGGGLQNENENIEIVEMEPLTFYELIDKGEIEDAKTYLSALLVREEF